jgi:hypothetical protein
VPASAWIPIKMDKLKSLAASVITIGATFTPFIFLSYFFFRVSRRLIVIRYRTNFNVDEFLFTLKIIIGQSWGYLAAWFSSCPKMIFLRRVVWYNLFYSRGLILVVSIYVSKVFINHYLVLLGIC